MIAVNPQQRSVRFPFSECAALNEPSCGSIMSGFACVTMIKRRIWRREPCLEFLLELIPCECLLASVVDDGMVKE